LAESSSVYVFRCCCAMPDPTLAGLTGTGLGLTGQESRPGMAREGANFVPPHEPESTNLIGCLPRHGGTLGGLSL